MANMQMYVIYKIKKNKRKLIFDSEYCVDKGDRFEIAIPKDQIAEVFEISKNKIYEMEPYKEKKDKKNKVINPLTQF